MSPREVWWGGSPQREPVGGRYKCRWQGVEGEGEGEGGGWWVRCVARVRGEGEGGSEGVVGEALRRGTHIL